MVWLLPAGLQTKDARHSMRRWAIDVNCLRLMAPLTLFKCEDGTPCWESSLRGVDGQQLQLAMGCFLVSVNVWIIALGGWGYNFVSRDLRGKTTLCVYVNVMGWLKLLSCHIWKCGLQSSDIVCAFLYAFSRLFSPTKGCLLLEVLFESCPYYSKSA